MFGQTSPLLLASLFLYIKLSAASTLNQTFIWGINTNLTKITSNGLAACSSVPIYVGPRAGGSSRGTPPYTMYAFEVGGYPTVQTIGSDPNNLTWTVDHLPGTTLMLSVLDSKNDTAGVDTTFYYVTDGPSTCQPSQSSTLSLPSISANVTDQLETCQPWVLTITGGAGPYTVWLPSLNSDQLTVVKMDEGFDVLTYPNEAVPNSKLMASVYDSTGAWGKSTTSVSTTGSNDTTCSGTNLVQSKSQQDVITTSSGHTSIGLIVGPVVGVVVLMCIAAALGFWYWRRRRDKQRGVWDSQAIMVDAWDPPSASSGERHQMYETSSQPSSVPLLGQSNDAATSSDLFSPSPLITSPSGSSPSTSHFPTVLTTTGPSPSSSKALEIQQRNMHRHPSSASSSQLAFPSSHLPPGAAPSTASGIYNQPIDSDTHPGVIIQHLDGGTGVQELPPPYMDRSDPSPTAAAATQDDTPRGKGGTRA